MIGKTLAGRYAIQALIGSGGMAVVYRAQDTRTRRTVAVKVLREEHLGDQEFLRRFDREAMAVAKTQHPHIVNLLDIGEEGDLRFLVMEYVQGSTLKELIQDQGRIRPELAVRYTLQVLSALAHAHQKHIVHRDIKPQNMLVDASGTVKLADFGIARMTDSTTMTMAENGIMGSVHYFSPEQAKGLQVGEASDLYSLGVVLYEMLTGRVPFDGETPVAVAMKHLSEIPKPVTMWAPDVSPAIEQVLAKAMCKNLAQRYASATQMSADLRRAMRQPEGGFVRMRPALPQETQRHTPVSATSRARGQQARQRRPARHGRILFAASVVLGLAVMGILGYVGYGLVQRMMRYVPMPNVMGLEEAVALEMVTKAGIEPFVVRQHDTAMVGTVVAQSPGEGEGMERGQSATLILSLGTDEQLVPELAALSEEVAAQLLADVGLVVGDELVLVSDAPVGQVIAQEPAAGEAAWDGMVVDLHISGGVSVVPSLNGAPFDEAVSRLADLGLAVGTVGYVDVDDPVQDTVVQNQHPQAEERVFPGTTVDLTVARVDRRPYKAAISVQVVIPAHGAHIRVTLLTPDGEEQEQYAAMHALEGENTLPLELRSALSGEMSFRVYVDEELMLTQPVTLK